MKLYLASSFAFVDKVSSIASFLEGQGHIITEKWWDRIYEAGHTTDLKVKYNDLPPGEFYALPETKESYHLDDQAVRDADALIFIADQDTRKYNGASVEYGIALGCGKPCFLLGELENSVLFYPLTRCINLYHLIYELTELEASWK